MPAPYALVRVFYHDPAAPPFENPGGANLKRGVEHAIIFDFFIVNYGAGHSIA